MWLFQSHTTQLPHDKLFPFVEAPDYSMISLWIYKYPYTKSAERTKSKYIRPLVTLRIHIHQCFLKPQSLSMYQEVEHPFILYMFHKSSLPHNTFSVNPYKHWIYELRFKYTKTNLPLMNKTTRDPMSKLKNPRMYHFSITNIWT